MVKNQNGNILIFLEPFSLPQILPNGPFMKPKIPVISTWKQIEQMTSGIGIKE